MKRACILAAVAAVMSAGLFAQTTRAEDLNADPSAASQPLTLMQIANPADAAKGVKDDSKATNLTLNAPTPARVHTYDAPPVTVVGENQDGLISEDRIGSYGQPRWTADRRFPNTRVYVIPEGKVEFEYWVRPTFGDEVTTRTLYEIEFGLPYRLQLDIYLRSDQEGKGDYEWAQQLELRYALADWGVIPGNPTIYLEYIRHENEADAFEPKLLLGGEIAPRWHWGVNLAMELALGDTREREFEINGGISYTVVDPSFSVGLEGKADFTDEQGSRGSFDDTYLIGPDVQWKPLPAVTINLVGLVGVGQGSPDGQVTLNIGYEF